MKQFIEEFKKGKTAVKFNDKKEVNQFMDICDGFGIAWEDSGKTTDRSYTNTHKVECVYFCRTDRSQGILHGSEWARNKKGYKIVNFADINKSKSIHITMHANTVHAILKENDKVIKRTKAVCNESDEFDFEHGARLAFDRLFNKVKEVKRKAEIGERIKIVKCDDRRYENGDIFKIESLNWNGVCITANNGHTAFVDDDEYVVLENYQPNLKEMTIEEIEQKLGHEIKIVK